MVAVDLPRPTEVGPRRERQRAFVAGVDQKRGGVMVPAHRQVVHEKLHGTRRVALATMGGEDVVAQVDLAGQEPLAVVVVVHPADDVALSLDARHRPRVVGAGPQPAVELLVPPRDQGLGVSGLGRTDRYQAVRRRSQRRLSPLPMRSRPRRPAERSSLRETRL